MAVVNDMYILQLERLRVKLKNILEQKNIKLDEEETLENLIEAVKQTDAKNTFQNYLNGQVPNIVISNDVTILREGVFKNAQALEKVKMPNVTKIEKSCFQGCENLKNVYMPNCISLDELAFYGSDIENLILPLAELSSMGNSAVFDTKRIKRLILQSLNSLGNYTSMPVELLDTYSPCQNQLGVKLPLLRTFIIRRNSIVNISSTALFASLEEVYVPQTMIEKYKTATNWSVYADKIKPLEGSKYEPLNWYEEEDWYKEEMSVWE